MEFEISNMPFPKDFLDFIEFEDIPEVDLPEGMQVPSEPLSIPTEAGVAPATPVSSEMQPLPEAAAPPEPAAPPAPEPMAGAGAPDGLSQLTQPQRGSEDTRADALFEE